MRKILIIACLFFLFLSTFLHGQTSLPFVNLSAGKEEQVIVDVQSDYIMVCVDPFGNQKCEIMYVVSDQVDDTGYGFIHYAFGGNTSRVSFYDGFITSILFKLEDVEYFCLTPNRF